MLLDTHHHLFFHQRTPILTPYGLKYHSNSADYLRLKRAIFGLLWMEELERWLSDLFGL
tara:strand:+ start:367 stop:543 length:177 start_codon:yes stop_codon:yes gene_type:complete